LNNATVGNRGELDNGLPLIIQRDFNNKKNLILPISFSKVLVILLCYIIILVYPFDGLVRDPSNYLGGKSPR